MLFVISCLMLLAVKIQKQNNFVCTRIRSVYAPMIDMAEDGDVTLPLWMFRWCFGVSQWCWEAEKVPRCCRMIGRRSGSNGSFSVMNGSVHDTMLRNTGHWLSEDTSAQGLVFPVRPCLWTGLTWSKGIKQACKLKEVRLMLCIE